MSNINLNASGVFSNISVNGGTTLEIPLSSIIYGNGTITEEEATGDYRALLRGIHETYEFFMTGVATGTDNPSDFNKPSFFKESAGSFNMFDADTATKTYSSQFYYSITSDTPLEPES